MVKKFRRIVIVVGGPLTINRYSHLNKKIRILKNLFKDILLIHEGCNEIPLDDKRVMVLKTGIPSTILNEKLPFILKIWYFIAQEINKVKLILKHVGKKDIVIFLGIYQPLSLLAVKLRQGFIIHFCGGFDTIYRRYYNCFYNRLYLAVRWVFQVSLLQLSQKLIFEAPSVINYFNLIRFKNKSYYGHLFVDLTKFSPKIPLRLRDYDIGYVGTLSHEKGIILFLESLSCILKQKKTKILIIGDGYLKNYLIEYIRRNKLQNNVDYKQYVNYSYMPNMLNKVRLLVVPSLSEGLPNVVVEAMACGTPILATSVGGIPDIIKDGVTGFLLKSNNPEYIAKKIIELLDKPQLLEKVSYNAYKFVKENFNYEKTLEDWRKILDKLM